MPFFGQQFTGIGKGLVRGRSAVQHAGKFPHPRIFRQPVDLGDGAVRDNAFGDQVMVIRRGSDLGQMGDAQHLVVTGQFPDFLRDLFSRLAADPGIDLVEDDRVDPVLFCQHAAKGQHQTRKFAAGRYSGQGFDRFAAVGGKQKFQLIETGSLQTRNRGGVGLFERNFESCLFQAERGEFLPQFIFQLDSRLPPQQRQGLGLPDSLLFQPADRFLAKRPDHAPGY